MRAGPARRTIARKMPTNPLTLPVPPRRTSPLPAGADAAALAARSAGMSLGGVRPMSGLAPTDPSFPNLLADALNGTGPGAASSLLSGLGPEALTGATLPAMARLGGDSDAGPMGLQGLLGSGSSALGGALSGLGNLAAMFGVGASSAPISPGQKIAGEKATETALGYLGRYDWNNYCERFVEVCYGTRNLYANAALAGRALATHKGTSSLPSAPVGAILYFAANAGNQQQGHAGLYLGDGRMISATPNGVKVERVDAPGYAGQFVGWAEPGSFGKGRLSGPATGNDPRVGGPFAAAGGSRTQSTSRIGMGSPPSLPRAAPGSTGAPGAVRLASPMAGGPTAMGQGASPSSTWRTTPPTSAAPGAGTVAPRAGRAPVTTATPALSALHPNAPATTVSRPFGPATTLTTPMPLTTRAVAAARAPLVSGAGNPLAPLSPTAGSTLNRRA